MALASRLGDRFRAEFAGRVIGVVAGAILIVVLARLLEPDGYGLLFLAISILGVVQLFSKLGVAKSAARYISEYKETDPGQIPHILRFALFLNLATITVTCVVFYLFHVEIAILVGEIDLIPLLLLGILFIAFGTLTLFGRTILQGFEAIQASALLHATDRGTRVIFAVGFVLLGYGAVGALAGYIVATVVTSVGGLGYIYLREYRGQIRGSIEQGLRRRISEYTIPLTATSTANVLDKRVDTILVGFFIGPVGVAYYTLGKQITQFVETPASALGFTISPTYGSLKANDEVDKASRLFETAFVNLLLIYIPVAVGLILVAEPTIQLFFGTEYLGAVPVLQVLAIYAALQSIGHIIDNGLDFLGHAKFRAIAKGVTGVMNVVLNIILIPLIGVVGAAIATVITASLYRLLNGYILYREFDFRLRWMIKKTTGICGIAVVMGTVVYALSSMVSGFSGLLFLMVTGSIIWMVLSILTGLLDYQKIISHLT